MKHYKKIVATLLTASACAAMVCTAGGNKEPKMVYAAQPENENGYHGEMISGGIFRGTKEEIRLQTTDIVNLAREEYFLALHRQEADILAAEDLLRAREEEKKKAAEDARVFREEAERKAAEEVKNRLAKEQAEEEARLAQEAAAQKAADAAAAAEAVKDIQLVPAEQEEEVEQASVQTATTDEQRLLAALIFCEAGNQPYEGQVAVGAVVMNRVRSSVYPNSIYEVIYQSGQFGPAMTGWLDTVLAGNGYTDTAVQAAADALAGSNPIGDCLYFGCGDYGIQIGDHFFH